MSEPAPLFSNGDLEKLADGILRLTKERKFAVYERFVAIRGVYERERLALHARIAELEAELQKAIQLYLRTEAELAEMDDEQ